MQIAREKGVTGLKLNEGCSFNPSDNRIFWFWNYRLLHMSYK
jgi:hypothetical protein